MRRLLVVTCCWLGALDPALAAPDVPAEAMLVWASNRTAGRHEIYRMEARGGPAVRLTQKGGKHPMWSPNGAWIAYFHTQDETGHVMRWDGTEDHQVCEGRPMFWMHDNSGVVCAQPRADWPGWDGSRSDRFLLASPALGTVRLLFDRNDFKHLRDDFGGVGVRHFTPGGITHDGRWMVAWVFGMFEHGYTADNSTFRAEHASVLLDMQDRSRLYFLGPGCTTTTPPEGSFVYHVSRVGPTAPDVFKLDVSDVETRSRYAKVLGVADPDWGHEYFPRISNDNRWLSYGASKDCHDWHECNYDIFLHPLDGAPQDRIRLTEHPANDNYPHLFVGPMWQRQSPELVPNRLLLTGRSDQPPSGTFMVAQVGDTPLGAPHLRVTYEGAAGWLETSVSPEGPHHKVEARVRPAGLPSGTHLARVEVTTSDARAVAQLPVRLELTTMAPPDAAVAPDASLPDGARGPSRGGGCAIGGAEAPSAWPLLLLAWRRAREGRRPSARASVNLP